MTRAHRDGLLTIVGMLVAGAAAITVCWLVGLFTVNFRLSVGLGIVTWVLVLVAFAMLAGRVCGS